MTSSPCTTPGSVEAQDDVIMVPKEENGLKTQASGGGALELDQKSRPSASGKTSLASSPSKLLRNIVVDVDGEVSPVGTRRSCPSWREMPSAAKTACRRFGANVASATKSTLAIYKASPVCWVAPLLLLIVMLALGIYGVEQGAKKESDTARKVAAAAAEGAAKSFELQLQQTYAPCITLALMVKQAPQWKDLQVLFKALAPTLLAQVPSDSLLEIQFAPQGVITDSYPDDPDATGRDLFFDPTRRAIALETVAQGALTVAGPVNLYRGGVGLVARIPVFLENQTANETYGMRSTAYQCDICYDPVTRRKFWGFSIAIIVWSRLVGPKSQLAQLTNLGYSYVLRQRNPSSPDDYIDVSSSIISPPPNVDMVMATINTRGEAMANLVAKSSFTDQWYLYVYPEKGWTPDWEAGALAGVILGAFIVCVLISAVMVNRMKHVVAVQQLKTTNHVLAETTDNLTREKTRLDALLERQFQLIAMFGKDNDMSTTKDEGSSTMERIEALRRTMATPTGLGASAPAILQLQIQELLGEGTFGKVYKGLWRGNTKVAIKTLILPANMSGTEKREKMAIMEAAISSSLSHPNIVQTYTYSVRPLADTSQDDVDNDSLIITTSSSTTDAKSIVQPGVLRPNSGTGAASTLFESSAQQVTGNGSAPGYAPASNTCMASESAMGIVTQSADASTTMSALDNNKSVMMNGGGGNGGRRQQGRNAQNVHSYEVRLVLEYCDKGTLREAVEQNAFFSSVGLNYLAILDTATDIAQAMYHLHTLDVLHGDLKARNIMLKSAGDEPRGFVAKVADFGLSIKMDQHATHVSSVYQGTMTHMAPEVMLQGHVSKAADVYAFGITLYELFTGAKPFHGVPGALLGHMIAYEKRRPVFPPITPAAFKSLAERCWAPEPADRPTFEEIAAELSRMRSEKGGSTPPVAIQVASTQPADDAAFGQVACALPKAHSKPAAAANGNAVMPLPPPGLSKPQVRWGLETLPELPASGAPSEGSAADPASQTPSGHLSQPSQQLSQASNLSDSAKLRKEGGQVTPPRSDPLVLSNNALGLRMSPDPPPVIIGDLDGNSLTFDSVDASPGLMGGSVMSRVAQASRGMGGTLRNSTLPSIEEGSGGRHSSEPASRDSQV